MVTLFFVVLMAKIPSPSVLSTQSATAWIRTGKRQAATALVGRGVLHPRLQWLHLPVAPRVVLMFLLALKRISTSSRMSSGHARRPCRTGGGGVIFVGSSGRVCSSSSRKELGTSPTT